MMHIHYDPASGEIVGWETGSIDPQGINGTAVLAIEADRPPDPLVYAVDLKTLTVVEMSLDERRRVRSPKLFEVNAAVYAELCRTDHFMIFDRPITEQARHAWVLYRQMLRDLSKLPSAAEMVEAWQLPPDGVDTVADLRERLKNDGV